MKSADPVVSTKKENIRSKISATLDMPVDFAGGMPRIVLTGNRTVLVENHSGIRAFSGEQVRIACIYGEIIIDGKDMRLNFLKKDEIEAEGQIVAISYRQA